jgi:hypothetical protein
MRNIIESTPPVSFRNYFLTRKNIHNNQFRDVTYTLRGRDAISIAVKNFGLRKQDTVLLPGYLCNIIVTPFNNNFSPMYYDIGGDLSINAEVIESILSTNKVKVLYIIHYFGYLHRNLNELSQLCKKYGVLLWEDHAHSAFSHISYEYADAMIFSFRKLLPIPDGGGLWLSNSAHMKFSSTSAISSNLISMLILIKRSNWSKRLKGITHQLSVNGTAPIRNGSKEIIPQPISYISKSIIKHTDVEKIFTIRRNIFTKWQNLFLNSRFEPVFASLPDNICPQSFPIRVKNPQELLSRLWDFNVRLRNRWPLDEQIKEKCPTAFKLSNTLFALPIYPGLLQSDMDRIMTLLEKYGEPHCAT